MNSAVLERPSTLAAIVHGSCEIHCFGIAYLHSTHLHIYEYWACICFIARKCRFPTSVLNVVAAHCSFRHQCSY